MKTKKQAERCVWTECEAKAAARDAILYQIDDKNLMKKIIIKDLSFDDTVTYGLEMEQGARKVKQIRGRMSGIEEDRVAILEKQRRALKAKDRSGRRVSCRTCTQPTHEQGKCPGKQVIWFSREQTGHFKGLPTCSTHFKKKTNKNLQGTAERTLETQIVKQTVKQTMIKLAES